MFIEIVESLRCLRPHEDSWLVGSFERMDGRTVVQGMLGCPICRAEYAIVDGVGYFDADPAAPLPPSQAVPDDPDEAVRAAALLDLASAGGIVLLAGGWAALGVQLAEMASVQVALVDPPAGVPRTEGVSVLRTGGVVPLAAGAVRGAAYDEGTARLADSVTRALRSRGRLVAPAALPLPEDTVELARDARHWVAERAVAPTAPVQLRVSRSRQTG